MPSNDSSVRDGLNHQSLKFMDWPAMMMLSGR
jgi:hypothetical protein